AVPDIGRMRDRADQRQREAEQRKAERNGGGRIVVTDQLELVVRRDARVDEEIGQHRDNSGAEIHQERRQPGERLQDQWRAPKSWFDRSMVDSSVLRNAWFNRSTMPMRWFSLATATECPALIQSQKIYHARHATSGNVPPLGGPDHDDLLCQRHFCRCFGPSISPA